MADDCYEIDNDLDPVIRSRLLYQAYCTNFRNFVGAKSGSTYELKVASTASEIDKTPLIEQMTNLVNPNLVVEGCVYLYFEPNKTIPPHIDDSTKRTSAITWALSPDIKNFAPVLFHDENNNLERVFHYSNKPLILNTRYKHSVKNNSYHRYSFQICLQNSIEELIEFDQENGILQDWKKFIAGGF